MYFIIYETGMIKKCRNFFELQEAIINSGENLFTVTKQVKVIREGDGIRVFDFNE